MDGASLVATAIQILITVICVVVPVAVMMGRIMERIRQIEKRLDGNGISLPGRCHVHATKMDSIERRLGQLEEA